MRRFHSFRRRQRAPMQWVPSVDYGTAVVATGAVQSRILVDATAGVSAGGVPAIARMTVRRIVGQVTASSTAAGTVTFSCGIIVRENSSTAAIIDPSAFADADARWLWLRHFAIANGQPALTDLRTNPDWSHVDVRVNRVLRPNEQLVFAFISNSAQSQLGPWLRTLISRVA